MRFIFLRTADDIMTEQLQKIIDELIQPNNIDVYRSIESLAQGIRLPMGEPCIALLMVVSRYQLQELLSIKDLIAGFRTILILPDDKEETISEGHRLAPRYVGFVGDNLLEFTAILGKTIQLMHMKSDYRHSLNIVAA